MNTPNRPVNSHKAYHAHVYYDQGRLAQATTLLEQIPKKFGLKLGRIFEKPVGPHPCWSCQIIFKKSEFDEFVPWLDENRNGLTIFIHAMTGNDLDDHTRYAYWLGDSVELDLSMFKHE